MTEEQITRLQLELANYKESAEYYQAELVKAHALLGRVIHQLSERWDSVNLTKYFPTSNLHRKKTSNNPSGKTKLDATQVSGIGPNTVTKDDLTRKPE